MVWRLLFLIKDMLGEKQFHQHLELHYDTQEFKKFLFLFTEAQKRSAETQGPPITQPKSIKPTSQNPKIKNQGSRPNPPSSSHSSSQNTQEIEATTQKIPLHTPSSKKEAVEDSPPPKRKPLVVEIDIPEEEVYEESVDNEPIWKEPKSQNNSQVIQLILLFLGVFIGVSLSLYLIDQLK